MSTNKAKPAVCRSKVHDNGIPWRCDRQQGHRGQHQVHFPDSRSVLKSWANKATTPSLPEWEGFDR
ncbi:hypothetical protein [Nocardia cyriacigeorgica]|uniref:hypothetical protein n=1 Tax=Nocardia cyriacigeorgica TaxID=135487 RepID=UPI0024558CE2|nr:hypothetical protein [Nocardia cyriacigeorgica]